ncbi:hypothetical protein MRB53_039285 [Persea americana]|nr:hypothetical protein MRB53_039285 [Persea americana]
MDGQSLSTLLHKRGINVRYLGKIASLASPAGASPDRTEAASDSGDDSKSIQARGQSHAQQCAARSREHSKSVCANRFELPSGWPQQIKHTQLLREIALKLGLQLGARDFAFVKEPDHANGHSAHEQPPSASANGNGHSSSKKKKRGADASSPPRSSPAQSLPLQCFYPEDVENIVPIMKHSAPRSTLAEEALEAGRISIAQGQRDLGQELLLESLTLHEQIYGILHPEVARGYYQLSTLFYNLDDKAVCVELAKKAVIVAERTLGVDSHETVLSYLNLGLFEHAAGNTHQALVYIRHALDLWKVVYGSHHPDSITTINNAAVMLQSLKLYHESRIWFEASLSISQQVSGKSSINTATLLFQLAQALALDQDSKASVARMREAYTIFKRRTRSRRPQHQGSRAMAGTAHTERSHDRQAR